MKSISFINHPVHNLFSTILLLGMGLFAAAGLTSCENFLNGEDIKKQIEEEIAYNNAKEIRVLVQAQEGTGSTVPSGNYTAKQGYFFDISFSENPAYSFLEWVAVSKDNPEQIITEGVTFENAASAVTKVKISNDSVAIRLIPKSEERIAISGEPSPRYDPLGVSRDRSITVSFTKEVSEDSFIFEASEIPEGAQTKRDSSGRIWAYIYANQTHLKNVSITNIDDYSIAEHFTCPVVSGKLLTIGVDRGNPIEFNSGEVYKTIKVTLSGEICSKSGVKMNSEKIWNYQITESTDEKATVTLSCTANEGFVYLAGTKDYSLGQKITLSFTEDADYQFVKWDYDSSIIYIAEPNSLNTVATVHEKTTEDNPTQIKAVCVPRLRVTSFAPVNTTTTPTVSKNSSIVITFNKNLPTAAEDRAQLQNITIAMGGSPVKSSFSAPVINENTITFAADNTNMLNVPSGQTKTVSVTIPSGFYYKLDNGTKVTYGGNGKTFDYKIDETTIDKAEVTFTATSNSGIIKSDTGTKQYSIGQEVALSFEAAEGWKFNGWNITAGGTAVSENKIKIANKSAPVTQFTVYEAIQGVTISANASQKFKVSSVTPTASVNPKDSSITITFNKNLASACSSLLDTIRVSVDGSSVDSNYSRVISTNKITLTNTKYLSVADGLQKTVTVTVPSTFYYKDGSVDVPLENDYSFTFVVNSDSTSKANITHAVAANAGTITPTAGLVNYSLDKEIPLTFTPAAGYEFTGWTVTTSSGSAVDNSKISIDDASKLSTKLRIYQSVSNVTVKANAYLVPTATTSPDYNGNGVDCDTAITINFNKAIDTSADVTLASNGVIQIVNASNEYEHYESHFNTPAWSNGNKTLTIRPKNTIRNIFASPTDLKNLRVKVDYSKIKDSEGHAVKVTGDSFWTYRIKYDMEKIAPSVTMKLFKRGFNITQQTITNENDPDYPIKFVAQEDGNYTELSSLAFENFQSATYPLNHVGKKVYFDAQVSDEGSGYNKLTINETLIRTVDGTPASGAETYSDIVSYSQDSFTNAIGQNAYKDYTFKTSMDGLIQLDFVFADNAGNETVKNWYVIKDTLIESSSVFKSRYNDQWVALPPVTDSATGEVLYYTESQTQIRKRITESDGSVKEQFSFSTSSDKYYSGKNSILGYEIKWGYSKSLGETAINREFVRDAKKDCFVREVCWDDVGNITYINRVIPKQVAIINFNNSGTALTFNFTDSDSLKSKVSSYNATDFKYFVVYNYQETKNSEISGFRSDYQSYVSYVTLINSKINKTSFRPAGIYNIYIIPVFTYTGEAYLGPLSEPFSIQIKYENGNQIVSKLDGSPHASPSFPNSLSCTLKTAVKNEGSRDIVVTPPSSMTEGYTYGVKYNKQNDTEIKYADFNFSVNSGYKYDVYIYAKDKSTGDIYSSSCKETIDATYDNISPSSLSNFFFLYASYPNRIRLLKIIKSHNGYEQAGLFPKDEGSAGLLKQNDLISLDYYIRRNNTNNNSSVSFIQQADLANMVAQHVSYSENEDLLDLEWSSFLEGYYTIALDLKDNNGNERIACANICNIVNPIIPKMFVADNNLLKMNGIIGKYGKYFYLSSDSKWKNLCEFQFSQYTGTNISYTELNNKVFVEASYCTTDSMNTLYSYFCPIYELKTAEQKAQFCRSKSVIPGLGGSYQVFYDAPCFAHTVAFPTDMLSDLDKKLTDAKAMSDYNSDLTDETYMAAIWETKGREYGLKLLNEAWEQGTATYTAPVNKIPAGFSYVTVFHFADGTSVMSEVKQK